MLNMNAWKNLKTCCDGTNGLGFLVAIKSFRKKLHIHRRGINALSIVVLIAFIECFQIHIHHKESFLEWLISN
jgi:hypothetical protein